MQKILIQGPLAGYSCAPFRKLIWQLSSPAFCCTEMISAKDLRYRKHSSNRYLFRDPSEKQLCYQISGNTADDIAYATEIVSKAGADIIDLNCGCPKPKIRRKNCGTKLLTQPSLLYQLIKTMKMNTNAKVSIKIRVSEPIGDHDDFAVIDAAQQAGVDFITVHGRHWTERYDIPARADTIRKIKQYATVPIMANGDVEDTHSLKQMLHETGCDGIMISRASLGQPWLFAQIAAELAGKVFQPPSPQEIGQLFLQHLQDLVALDGEHLAILQSRKLAKYYARHCEASNPFVVEMQQQHKMSDVERSVERFFI